MKNAFIVDISKGRTNDIRPLHIKQLKLTLIREINKIFKINLKIAKKRIYIIYSEIKMSSSNDSKFGKRREKNENIIINIL